MKTVFTSMVLTLALLIPHYPLIALELDESDVQKVLTKYSKNIKGNVYGGSDLKNALENIRRKKFISLRPLLLKVTEKLSADYFVNTGLRRDCLVTLASLPHENNLSELKKHIELNGRTDLGAVRALCVLGTKEAFEFLADYAPSDTNTYVKELTKEKPQTLVNAFKAKLLSSHKEPTKNAKWKNGIFLALGIWKWKPETIDEKLIFYLRVQPAAIKALPYNERKEALKAHEAAFSSEGPTLLPALVKLLRDKAKAKQSMETEKQALLELFSMKVPWQEEYYIDLSLLHYNAKAKWKLLQMGERALPILHIYAESSDKKVKRKALYYSGLLTCASHYGSITLYGTYGLLGLTLSLLLLGWLFSSLPHLPEKVDQETLKEFYEKACDAIDAESFKSLVFGFFTMTLTFFAYSHVYFIRPEFHRGLTRLNEIYSNSHFFVPLMICLIATFFMIGLINPFKYRMNKVKSSFVHGFSNLPPNECKTFLEGRLLSQNVNEELLSTLMSDEFLTATYKTPQELYHLLVTLKRSSVKGFYDYRFVKLGNLNTLWDPFAKTLASQGFNLEAEDLSSFGSDAQHPFKLIEPGILVKVEREVASSVKEFFSPFPKEVSVPLGQAFGNDIGAVKSRLKDIDHVMILPTSHQVVFSEEFQELKLQELVTVIFSKNISGGTEETRILRLLSYTYDSGGLKSYEIDECSDDSMRVLPNEGMAENS